MIRVLLIEDDRLNSNAVIRSLSSQFDGLDIQLIESEVDLVESLSRLETAPPDIAIVDITIGQQSAVLSNNVSRSPTTTAAQNKAYEGEREGHKL